MNAIKRTLVISALGLASLHAVASGAASPGDRHDAASRAADAGRQAITAGEAATAGNPRVETAGSRQPGPLLPLAPHRPLRPLGEPRDFVLVCVA